VPDLRWSPGRGQYRDAATGQWLSRAAVRREVDASLANVTRLSDTLADDLRAGRISLNQWREEMRAVIKHTQMGAAEIANGGRAQMAPQSWGATGQKIRAQYIYLENWVEQLKAGLPVDNRVEGRARQYIRAARTSFIAAEAQDMAAKGWLARNVTTAAESCAECLAEEAKGLVPVNQLSTPGTRICRGACKCFLVYERAA
jgi:hypothetical protein